ncbi:MAG TPA: hypothetical protein VD972_21495, partial [Hyalangium sp.]|nr:hypothetical protein [Hyalangium sp.]
YLPPCTDGGEPVEREVLPPSAMATVCRELEALTLRLLSDDRKLRGSAEQLVKDTAVRVQTAGTEADRPILPTSNATRTEEGYAPAASSSSEEGSRASSDGQDNEEVLSDSGLSDPPTERECPPPSVPAWLSWVGSSAVGGLVAAGVLLMVLLPLQLRQEQDPEPEPAPWLATPEEPAQFATDGGVAEEALAGVQDVPGVVMPLILAVGKPMPDQPFPGQRKPPCDPDTQLVVYGACWSVLKKEAPCGPNAYDYEGRCLLPFFTSPRKPTSGEP